jgi:hypothetical protein
VDDANMLAQDRRPKSKSSDPAVPNRLNEFERPMLAQARREGFLTMRNGATQSVVNAYFKYCCSQQRPYVAASKHGECVVVVLTSMEGIGGERNDIGVTRMLDEAQRMATAGSWAFTNHSSENDTEEAFEKMMEGSTVGKPLDTELDEAFTVATSSRREAVALATEVYAAYTSAFDVPTPSDMAEAKRRRAEERRAAWVERMRERIRLASADPKLAPMFPKGWADGFLAADAEGRLEEFENAEWNGEGAWMMGRA